MRMTSELPDHGAVLEAVLDGFVDAAMIIIGAGLAPLYPHLANVQYREESAGQEDWKLPNRVVQDGWGDCEDLCIWLAAGLRLSGEDESAECRVVQTGRRRLHCVVQRSDGEMQDPSYELKVKQVMLGADHRGPKQSSPGGPVNPNLPPAYDPNNPDNRLVAENRHWDQGQGAGHGMRAPEGSIAYESRRKYFDTHPQQQAIQQAADIRETYGETAQYTGGKPVSTALYSSPDEAYAAGINPDTGVRYTVMEWAQEQGAQDPNAWGDPNDPWGQGQYPQAPWGGGYGSDYGYGGDFGYGYGYGGWMNQPLYTYQDLYGDDVPDAPEPDAYGW